MRRQTSPIQSIRRTNERRPAVTERGMALVMVVVVLTTLLIIGTLFLQSAHLELNSATFYKSTNEATILAQSGFARATAELMYDVWGANEIRPFVADRWTYSGKDNTPGFDGRSTGRDVYIPMALGDSYPKGFYKDDGGSISAYKQNQLPIIRKRSLLMKHERTLHFERPKRVFNVRSGQKEEGDYKVLTGWGDWHIEQDDAGSWENAVELAGFGGNTWKPGADRWHDGFLPRSTDVNDLWEYGLHVNRIFPAGSGGPAKQDRDFGNDAIISFSSASGQTWPGGLEYNVGKVNERAVTDRPWNYINSQTICSDSFFRIFRYELVDTNSFQALNPRTGKTLSGAMHLGEKNWGVYGSSGPGLNINQVNNNYFYEFYNDQGTVDPSSGKAVDVKMYHYNEAKWIYVYDEDENPIGRYAVTIMPDGGQLNINATGQIKRFGALTFFPDDSAYSYINAWTVYDWGYNVWGVTLNARVTDDNVALLADDKNYGANIIRTGRLNNLYNPKTGAMFAVDTIGGISEWSRRTMSQSGVDFAYALTHHLNAYFFTYGSLSSRSEIAIYLRKSGFLYMEDLNGDGINSNAVLDRTGDMLVTGSDLALSRALSMDQMIDKKDEAITNEDAWRIASMFGPHSYAYTFDRLWDNDRIVVDFGGLPGNAVYEQGNEHGTKDKDTYEDPRAIGSYNETFDAVAGATPYGRTYYNYKLNKPSSGLIKFTRMLANLRFIAGEQAGQWSPLSPHGTDRSKWRQAGKAEATLLSAFLCKGSSFRLYANGISPTDGSWMPYTAYGVRVDYFKGASGSGNEVKDPLIEVYVNPSRKLLVQDVEGGNNPLGGAPFTKGFSDIRIYNPSLLTITEVGRAPILGDVRASEFDRTWYNNWGGGTSVINGSASWDNAYPKGTILNNSRKVQELGFYQLRVIAHTEYKNNRNFSMEKKPLIMNYIEMLNTQVQGANDQVNRSLSVSTSNVFTRAGIVGGLKHGSASKGPNGTYVWIRGLFYTGDNPTGPVPADTWYMVEMDLLNPWCDRKSWPYFDDRSANREGAFNAWRLSGQYQNFPHSAKIWDTDLKTTGHEVNNDDELLTLKRRIFGWKGNMVFIRYKSKIYDPPGDDGARTYYRSDSPVRVLCQRSGSGFDQFGLTRTIFYAPDQNNANGCWMTSQSSFDGRNPNYRHKQNPQGLGSAFGYACVTGLDKWYSFSGKSAPSWTSRQRPEILVNSGDHFNYRDGWWDPSNSGGMRGSFCMGYWQTYYAPLATPDTRIDGSGSIIDYWSQLFDHPHQYLTIWFHPYLYPMLIVYGAADYFNNSWTSSNPYDRVYDFAMLPNYLMGDPDIGNVNKQFTEHAKKGPVWWDYGGAAGGAVDRYGFYDTGDFWSNPPTYDPPNCDIEDVSGNTRDADVDLTLSNKDFITVGYVGGRMNRDGLGADGYGRKGSEKYIRHLQKGQISRIGGGNGGIFFSCSAVAFNNNDDPGMWVYGWTGDGNSFSWRQTNRTTSDEVQYSLVSSKGSGDDALILSRNVFISGNNIGKRIINNIYPTPHQRNCVWYTDALFYTTSNEGNPDQNANDPQEWPWYAHNDGSRNLKEYTHYYDQNGNNRWCNWLATLKGGWDCRQTGDSSDDDNVNSQNGEIWLTRKSNIQSAPVAYLELSDIDPLVLNAQDLAMYCGMSDIWSLGFNVINTANGTDFWGQSYTPTRKTDLMFDFQTYRDYVDNDNDGVADICTDAPFTYNKTNDQNVLKWWTYRNKPEDWIDKERTDINHSDKANGIEPGHTGYYNSDRKVNKKIFINLSFHPMVITHLTWQYYGLNMRSNLILGQKPDLGFTDERQFQWWWTPSYDASHPYYVSINKKNTHWNKCLSTNEWQVGMDAYMSGRSPNFTEFGVSPVYTIIVTGQTIKPDGTTHTQSKLQATVERTWDGKMNILEYQTIPGLFDTQY